MEVSKGSDAEDPEYLGAGGTWGLGTDLSHGAEVSEGSKDCIGPRAMRKSSLAGVDWEGVGLKAISLSSGGLRPLGTCLGPRE